MKVQDKILELKADKKFVFNKFLKYYESNEIGCDVLFYSNMVDLLIKKLNKIDGDEIPEEFLTNGEFEKIKALYNKCIELMKD